MRQQPLRRRRLLRPGLRAAPAEAARCRRRWAMHARSPNGGDDPREHVRDPSPRRPAAPTASATARAAAAGTGPAPSAPPSAARATSTRPSPPAAPPGRASRPTRSTCVPFACNGSKCFGACTVDANCSPGNVCIGNSCGKKPHGAFCSAGAECVSGNCAQGVCCATACASACRSCALSGTMGPAPTSPPNSPDPAQICVDMTGTCGTNGRCAGRRLPAVRAGDALRGRELPGRRHHADARVDLRRRRHLRHAACELLLPVQVRRRRRASRPAPPTPTARRPNVCNSGSCGLQAARRQLRRPGGLPERASARRASAARPPAPPAACRARWSATSAPASRSPPVARIPRGSAPRGGRGELRQDRFLRRRRRLPAATRPAPSAPPPSCPNGVDHGDARPHLRRRRHLPPADDAVVRHLRVQRQHLQRRLRRRRRLRARQRLQRRRVRTEAPRPAVRRPPANATAATASRASAARPPCAATASRATSPAWRASCNPVGADEMEPHGGCTPNPPAGSTASATATAPAATPPPPPAAGPPRAAGPRSRRSATATARAAACRPPTSCAPFACGARRLPHHLRRRRRLRRRLHLHVGLCTNLKANGAACVAGTECFSGNCTEGFCCASASCASCNSCAVAGKQGTCQPVPAGPGPDRGLPACRRRPAGPPGAATGPAVRDLSGGHHLHAVDLRRGDADGAAPAAPPHQCTSQMTIARRSPATAAARARPAVPTPPTALPAFTCNAPACEPLLSP